MTEPIVSPTGKKLQHRTTMNTTPRSDISTKTVKIPFDKKTRLEENREFLKNKNVAAFLKTIADAEGGGYDFKYGAVKGKKMILGVSATSQLIPEPVLVAKQLQLECIKSTSTHGETRAR